MAENGVNGHQSSGWMQWKVGLMNEEGMYMTAEAFGFKANASGTGLKKKQIWTIEQDPVQNWVYLKSHLGRYLTSDKYGDVKADVEFENLGVDEKFLIEYSPDGKWAFKHATHQNLYLTGTRDKILCPTKNKSGKAWWSIQLYVHPQVNLHNCSRKRYAHYNMATEELECSEVIPWGADSLITLDFKKGKYTMKACNGHYLNREGGLDQKDEPDDANMFTMEIHSGCLAFKDSEGRYLTAVGKGSMKGKNKSVNKDELFTIVDSHPQIQIKAQNDKYVSVKQGVDVSANQLPPKDDIGDSELFQLEYLKATDSWAIRTHKGNYWCLKSEFVQANSATLTKDGHFKIEWLENGKVGIKGADGKYLSNRPTGVLFSDSESLGVTNKFTISLVNRPLLVLKSEFGYVGIKNEKSDQYVCNKTRYDALEVAPTGTGSYTIKGANDRYLGIGDDNSLSLVDGPTEFYFQFHGQSMLTMTAPNGKYMKGEQNGLFQATGEEIAPNTLLEY